MYNQWALDDIRKHVTYEKLEAVLVKTVRYLDMVKKILTFRFRKTVIRSFMMKFFIF